VEEMTDYQDYGDFSAGRIYTVYKTNGNVTRITMRDLYIYPDHQPGPEIPVYDISGVNGYPREAENPANNYSAPSVPAVSPSPYSPEYFTGPSQVITPPVAKVFALADGIEDTLEERYIPDVHDDNDQGQVIDPSHIIIHAYGQVYQISDRIEDRIEDRYFNHSGTVKTNRDCGAQSPSE
jgi:hypothetical protein